MIDSDGALKVSDVWSKGGAAGATHVLQNWTTGTAAAINGVQYLAMTAPEALSTTRTSNTSSRHGNKSSRAWVANRGLGFLGMHIQGDKPYEGWFLVGTSGQTAEVTIELQCTELHIDADAAAAAAAGGGGGGGGGGTGNTVGATDATVASSQTFSINTAPYSWEKVKISNLGLNVDCAGNGVLVVATTTPGVEVRVDMVYFQPAAWGR